MTNDYLKKGITSLIILGLFFGSTGPVFAVEPALPVNNGMQPMANPLLPPPSNTQTKGISADMSVQEFEQRSRGLQKYPANNDPQVNAYLGNNGGGPGVGSGLAAGVGTSLLGCSAGALLGSLLAAGFNALFNLLSDALAALISRLVPVAERGPTGQKIAADTAAHTAQLTIFGIPIGASFDAMGWCIVNSIITYVADSTIAWANTGFNGKPAFIQNPERFFQNLADREAANFIHALAYNTAGINLCQPFRVEISVGLSSVYGDSMYGPGYGAYSRRAACTIDQMNSNIKNFGKNSISIGTGVQNNRLNNYWGGWNAVRRDPNNVWGSYMMASDYMSARISRQQNVARFDIGLNRGWLSFKKCADKNDPKSCDVYTPGTLIQSSLEKTLGMPKDRLVLAQKFDQVVTAIVNGLIKVALQKVLEK